MVKTQKLRRLIKYVKLGRVINFRVFKAHGTKKNNNCERKRHAVTLFHATAL